MQNINTYRIILLTLSCIVFFLLQSRGQESFSLFNNISNRAFINQSNTPKLLLTNKWELLVDGTEIYKNISIPYFLQDKSVNKVTFRNKFVISEINDEYTPRLWILGLNGRSIIKLNDHILTEHTDISTSFKIDLNKKFLNEKSNVLEITLTRPKNDNSLPIMQYPLLFTQFKPLGVSGNVYLEILPDAYFEDIIINLDENKLRLLYKTVIKEQQLDKKRKIRIDEKIISPTGKIVHTRFEYIDYEHIEKYFSREILLRKPEKWSTDNPVLYQLILSLKTSTSVIFRLQKKFGLRTIQAKNNQIFLNNESIQIKGINYRPSYINSDTDTNIHLNTIQLDFERIKETGFNSIRFVNYVPHPFAAKLADSLGLLLFLDNGIWRMPESNFNDSRVLQLAKNILKEIMDVFGNNTSVAAVGLGHEIPIDLPSARKFIIILEKQLKQKHNILSYISPLTLNFKWRNKISDIDLLFKYSDPGGIFSQIKSTNLTSPSTLFAGNVGYPCISDSVDLNNYGEKKQYQHFYDFFIKYESEKLFNGFFIESFKDWNGMILSPVTISDHEENVIYPYGIFDTNNHARLSYQYFYNYLNNEENELQYQFSSIRTNFFSITMFIGTIIFFLLYKRIYRLKENFKRSMQHPYGFFVDLRDRRIMSILNSTIVGVMIGIIMAIFISSILYALKDYLWLDEFISIFISDFEIKSYYLSVINSPWQLFIHTLIIVVVFHILLAFILRLIAMFSKETIKLRQTYAVTSWSGAHLLLFIPVSIFTYNLTIANIFSTELLWVFLLFVIWYNYRFANGMRVLFQVKLSRMIIFMILTYILLLITFFVISKSSIHSIEYIDILFEARDLYH